MSASAGPGDEFGATLPAILVEDAARAALVEDLGRAGDVTSQATIPPEAAAEALVVARRPGIVAGLDLVEAAFRLAGGCECQLRTGDGARVAAGEAVARITGSARAILAGERVALNFLCHLSGIATATAEFAARIAHTPARITCTRKTTPGLRPFEKYAVRCGGGVNHRFGLDDAILIKDNHIAVCGSVADAVSRARSAAGHLVKVEVEVDTLDQLQEALGAGPDVVLLDNMDPETLRRAVEINDGRAVLEASGGVTLATVAAIAEAGVDRISVGWITHSAPILDFGLDMDLSPLA